MNIWHFYARYYNFGDYALGVGMRNILTRYCRDNYIFKLFDTHGFSFDIKTIDTVNASADLLLVGGGGLIHEFRGKWLFALPDILIPRLEVPVIFYGLGYNAFPGQPDISRKIITNIKRLQEKAISFSVRDDGSKERLAKVGIEVPDVPDPGFFVDTCYPRPSIDGRYVVIQLANDMKKYRGFEDNALLRGIQKIVEFLIKRNYKVVLAPHVRVDIILFDKLMNSMRNPRGLSIWDLYDLLRDEHTLKGLAYYKYADFVITMRGHGQICPMAMGTPVITISNHEKNLGLLKKRKVSPLSVNVQDVQLVDRLLDLV